MKNSGSLTVAAGFISPLSMAASLTDKEAAYDNFAPVREARRARLSEEVGKLFEQMCKATPEERVSWYRANRGKFYFSRQDIDVRLHEIHRRIPGRRTEMIQTADRLLRHEFDILGSGLKSLGDVIDWHRDFKSGRQWSDKQIFPPSTWHGPELSGPNVYRGPLYSVDGPADLKVPWDLSSFFYFPVLAEAYLLTQQDKYAAEVFSELRDWQQKNPYQFGVNWTSAMPAALRLANIVYTLRLLGDFAQSAPYEAEIGVVSTLRHVEFILEGLEIHGRDERNNHYLSDLVGLAFGAVEFAKHPAGQSLLDFVHDEFAHELTAQFLPDGAGFEGSIPYHRFSTECALLTLILLERNGRSISQGSRQQLQQILHFIDLYTKPNGLAPQVGDNDNGRILVLHDYAHQEYRDHRHILAVGAAWLGIGPLLSDVSAQAPDTLWLLGKIPPTCRPIGAKAEAGTYRDGGYAVAKVAETSLLVRAGRIHPISGGGHNHCDQLSFEFQDRGEDLFIDCGAMVYGASGALRNQFRSTASHNTLQLDDMEQQEFDPRSLFSMDEKANATIDSWEVNGSIARFHGHHTAYASAGWQVAREVRCDLDKGRCEIRDDVMAVSEKTKGNQFCGRLHLASGIQVDAIDSRTYRLHSPKHQWIARLSNNLQVSVRPGQVSSSYGVMTNAMVIEYRFAAKSGQHAEITVERETKDNNAS